MVLSRVRRTIQKKAPSTNRRKVQRTYQRKSRIPSYPFTQQKLVKLRYSEHKSYTSTAGSVSSQIYRLNDLFDPDVTGVGHQSLYRDQLFSIYARARVIGAAIYIKGCSVSPNVIKVVCGPIQSGSVDTNMDTAAERKGARSVFYNPNSNGVMMKYYSSCDNYFGHSKGTSRRDLDYIQVPGSSLAAAHSMWFQIIMREAGIGNAQMWIDVTIVQYVIFEQPLQVASS